MVFINDDTINEIRNNTDIVEVISNYVPLTKKGKNYFGVCPFHDDHSPSMSVDPVKQIYKCFSCGAGGNVFTFVMNYENIEFVPAVKLLGSRLGINISGIKDSSKVNNKEYNAYEIAAKYYQNNIYTSLGKKAIDYLEQRKIDKETIKKFGIGLALKDNKLTSMLIQKGYSINELINLGLSNDNNTDFFLNRIIFPIHNLNGKVVAFSGRIYNTSSENKYVNTKETSIFKKGSILYNYHNAKSTLKKNDYIIVMEGFLDVIRASTIGINNCVATLGTAITKEHINLLKKISDNIILCFDGDAAGEKATITCIQMLSEIGISPKIIRLKENLDPDEYILKYGSSAFESQIKNPLSVTDFNLTILKNGKNLTEIDDIAKYINEVLKALVKEEDLIKVDIILNKLSKEYNITYNSLNEKYQSLLKQNVKVKKEEVKQEIKKEQRPKQHIIACKSLIYYMLKYDEVINMVENRVSYMPDAKYRNLSNEIIYYYHKYGTLKEADFYTHLINNNPKLLETMQEIEILNINEQYSQEAIDDYILAITKANLKEREKNLKNKIDEEVDIMKKAEIANSKFNIKINGGIYDRRN